MVIAVRVDEYYNLIHMRLACGEKWNGHFDPAGIKPEAVKELEFLAEQDGVKFFQIEDMVNGKHAVVAVIFYLREEYEILAHEQALDTYHRLKK